MKYTTTTRKRRGSILLMVVGLLTIIYMLGGSFLIIASLDRKQSRAIMRSGDAHGTARSILGLVQQQLKGDLYFDETDANAAIYSDLSGTDAHLQFIDYPANETDGDYWLATPYYRGMTKWRYLGNPSKTNGVNLGNVSWSTNNDIEYGDTDGDGKMDGVKFFSGMTDPNGSAVMATVRVLDTSAFANVNVAWRTDSLTRPTSPVNYELKDLTQLNWGWSRLEDGRIDGDWPNSINEQAFLAQCAGRMLHPDGSTYRFKPFGIAEELFLRDSNPKSLPVLVASGEQRVGDLPLAFVNGYTNSQLWTHYRRQLTTRSISRSVLRHPRSRDDQRLQLNGTDLNDPNNLQWMYGQLVDAGAEPQEAAHVVANLWAYSTNGDPMANAYAFQPTANAAVQKVYGVVPQLVITEVFVYSESETSNGADDAGYGIAIELMNPTWEPVSTGNYHVELLQNGGGNTPSDTFDFSTIPGGAPTVPAGGRIVLYHFDGQIKDGSGNKKDANLATFGFDGITVPKFQVTQLEGFNRRKVIRVYRQVTNGAVTEKIPLDQVICSEAVELDYPYNNVKTHDNQFDTSVGRDIRRDDDWGVYNPSNRKLGGRDRATVAVYKSYHDGDENDHKLGQKKNIGASELSDVFQGFAIHRSENGFVRDLGELVRLYRTGPTADRNVNALAQMGLGLPQQLAAEYKDDLTRGMIDLHGMAKAVGGTAYPSLPWATILMELVEVLPTDSGMADDGRRHYGKININTAEKDVLMHLPWPAAVFGYNKYDGSEINDTEKEKLVDYILAYRDGRPTSDGRYNFADRATATGVAWLRAGVTANGYLTEAEVAIPLAMYAYGRLGDPANFAKTTRYIDMYGVDRIYHAISNLITVRSDTYAVLIKLTSGGLEGLPVRERRFLGFLDRSNCRKRTDEPAILLFSEMK